MDQGSLQSRLESAGFSAIHYFETIGSTNDFALKWIEQGAADASLVFANQQTAGRGRMRRRWITEPGSALAFSLILRPTAQEIPHLQLFSPLGALAVCAALESYGLKAQIKWPNDVLLEGKKTAGILLEAVWQDNHPQAVVIGIGVNVAPSSVPDPEMVLFPATCIESVARRHVDRLDLLYNILVEYRQWRAQLGSDSFLRAWQERLAYMGQWVQIEQPHDQRIFGRIAGVEPNGNVLIRDKQDKIISVAAGEIHLRPIQGNQPATPGGSENAR